MLAALATVGTAYRRFRSKERLTLVGHSHLKALAQALKTTDARVKVVDFWEKSDPFKGNELELIDEILPPRLKGPVVSFIGGSRHEHLTLYRHPRPFDFVLPGEPDPHTDPEAEIIPLDAIIAALKREMLASCNLMIEVRRRTDGPMFHMDSPPPWGDERRVEDNPHLFWPNPTDKFGERYVRRRMSRLHSQVLRAFCEANAITLIPSPPEAADAEGFLAPPFHHDLLHANSAYGALVLEAVRGAVSARN